MDVGVRDAHHAGEKSPITVCQDGGSSCPVCELCGTFEGLKICAACKDVWYCCKAHQRSHWSEHKTACKSQGARPRKLHCPSPANNNNNNTGHDHVVAVAPAGPDSSSGKADPRQQPAVYPVDRVVDRCESKSASGEVCLLHSARTHADTHAGTVAITAAGTTTADTIVPTTVQEGALGGGSVTVVSEKGESGCVPTHAAAAAAAAEEEDIAPSCPCAQACSHTDKVEASGDPTPTNSPTPSPPAASEMTQSKCGAQCLPSQATTTRDKPLSKSARRRARKASLASSSGSASSSSLASTSLASSHPSSGSLTSSHASSGSLISSHASSGSLISRNTSSTSLTSSSSTSSLTAAIGDVDLQASGFPNADTMPEPSSATKDLADYIVKYLTEYGICVVDKFLGASKGDCLYDEVIRLHGKGIFQDGQLISPHGPKQKVRGDQIMWVERGDPNKDQISFLVGRLDNLMMACNERFRRNDIGGRTKAMVACYPGSGAYYLRHVDNPNEDGRLITCIYYLNKNWDAKRDGGMLRIFPESIKNTWVADIEPMFDRLLFFWSDRRNPHEVQAAYKQRFAITVWYFDKAERQQALNRHQSRDSKHGNACIMSTTLKRASPEHE